VDHLSGPALHPTRIVSIESTAVAARAAVSLARTATVKSTSGVRRKTTGSNGPAPKRMDRSACATPRARTTPATPPHTHPHDPLRHGLDQDPTRSGAAREADPDLPPTTYDGVSDQWIQVHDRDEELYRRERRR